MKSKCISSGIIFSCTGSDALRNAVRDISEKFGFSWNETCDNEDWAVKPAVIVGYKDDVEKIGRKRWELIVDKYRGAEDERYYPSEFSVEIGKEGRFYHDEDDSDFVISMSDWLVDEVSFYGRKEFVFCDEGNMSPKDAEVFARQLAVVAEKLTGYLWVDEERIARFKERAVDEVMRKKDEFIKNGANDEELQELDLVLSVIKDDLKVDVIEEYDTYVWSAVAKHGLRIVCGYFLELNVQSFRFTTDMSPMMEAVIAGDVEIVEMMLLNGWSANEWTDVDYDTPLRLAAALGSEKMFFLLVKYGAKLFLEGRDYEITSSIEGEKFTIGPDDLLFDAVKGKSVKICKYLIGRVDLSKWPKSIPYGFWEEEGLWDEEVGDFCLNSGIPELNVCYERLKEMYNRRDSK